MVVERRRQQDGTMSHYVKESFNIGFLFDFD